MSYTIVYDRQFLKLEDGRIIPMILCGANNCWETSYDGRERRERYWTALWEQIVPAYKPEELMKKAESYCSGGEYQEHFMRGGKWVDDAAFLRFFQNGINQAKTMQELTDERIHTPSIRAFFSVWTRVPGKKEWEGNHSTECDRYLRSDEELVAFLIEADERLKRKTADESIYVCLKYFGNDPLPKPKRERKPKTRLTGEFYVVTFGIGSYVTKLTGRHLHHCPYISSAKQFQTAKDAEKWIEQRHLKSRFRVDCTVEKAA